jgi:hypothetical protein
MLTGSLPRLSTLHRALALASLIGLTMCENTDTIDIGIAGKVTLPKATLTDTALGDVAFGGFDHADFSETLKTRLVAPEDIDAVHLRALTLLVETPSTGSFDFMTSAHVFITADGLPKIELGSLDTVPKGKYLLDLSLNTTAELRPYIVAPSVKILTEITGSKPKEETTVAAAVVVVMDIHIPGCH